MAGETLCHPLQQTAQGHFTFARPLLGVAFVVPQNWAARADSSAFQVQSSALVS